MLFLSPYLSTKYFKQAKLLVLSANRIGFKKDKVIF